MKVTFAELAVSYLHVARVGPRQRHIDSAVLNLSSRYARMLTTERQLNHSLCKSWVRFLQIASQLGKLPVLAVVRTPQSPPVNRDLHQGTRTLRN